MPAAISKLINQLKRSYPELKDEPMLDDIEAAAYADEAPAEDDLMPSDDSAAQEAEPAAFDGGEDFPPIDEEGEDLPPPAKRKGKKNAPSDDPEDFADEPVDINGGF